MLRLQAQDRQVAGADDQAAELIFGVGGIIALRRPCRLKAFFAIRTERLLRW